MSPSHASPLPGFPRSGPGAHRNFPLLTLVKRWMSNAGYYPVLVIFSQRNSPASEPGQRIFSVSPGTAGNRLDRWLAECLPAVSRARIHPTAVEGDYTASDDDPMRQVELRLVAYALSLAPASRRAASLEKPAIALWDCQSVA